MDLEWHGICYWGRGAVVLLLFEKVELEELLLEHIPVGLPLVLFLFDIPTELKPFNSIYSLKYSLYNLIY